ncbi:MAG: hypothetical protein M3R02_23355 [Chloroflexota bacterium]|nr:hypothetical protein [Chloroflexota bacterium]
MDPTAPRDRYETSDLSLAGAILAAGHKLDRIERRVGRGWFCFEPDPRIGATVAAFYGGSLRVDARTLTDHLRALKQALHNPVGAL